MDAAILFEADAFRLDGKKLMGRQAAGNGFIRGMVGANSGGELWGFSPYGDSSAMFRRTVHEIDPSVETKWIGRSDLKRMAERRVLFRPDSMLLDMAALRLRAGVGAYSICGVTHTLSGSSMADIARSSHSPLMPWDALICTSRAAQAVIEDLLGAERDYLAWRFGQAVEPPRIQLPVIPLGVHTADFADRSAKRPAARARLGIADDEVAVLFAGRLSFHAKAHPFQMYAALQAAAERTGKRLVLILAGQAPNDPVKEALAEGMAKFCPAVRGLFVDGKDFEAYGAAWAAPDIFMSISDNIQETFGITPIEAMASGIPVIVSDWDGYRDTITDGEVGFRIPSYAPAPGSGDPIALGYETGDLNYDYYIYRACMATGVDPDILAERTTLLVGDADLRRRFGEAGKARAKAVYDWAVVYRQYQALWDELDAIRLAERGAPRWANAPRSAPGARDPFAAFGAFATHHIGPQTRIAARAGGSPDAYSRLQSAKFFEHWQIAPPVIEAIFTALPDEPTCADLARKAVLSEPLMCEVIGRLVKMNLVRALYPAAPVGVNLATRS